MRLSRGGLWAIAGAAAAIGLALVPLIAASDLISDHALWIELDLVIGAGFAGSGSSRGIGDRDNRMGLLMVACSGARTALRTSF
jgi:hypothetical protein